jgi:hypothetical protein
MAEMNSQNPDVEGDYQSKIQNGITTLAVALMLLANCGLLPIL